VTTLDKFVEANAIRRVDLMKVDVEGDELNVFLGGKQLLSTPFAPAITFEINTSCLSARALTPDDVQAGELDDRRTQPALRYRGFRGHSVGRVNSCGQKRSQGKEAGPAARDGLSSGAGSRRAEENIRAIAARLAGHQPLKPFKRKQQCQCRGIVSLTHFLHPVLQHL
jgi:Methyltransferase FkbM domain